MSDEKQAGCSRKQVMKPVLTSMPLHDSLLIVLPLFFRFVAALAFFAVMEFYIGTGMLLMMTATAATVSAAMTFRPLGTAVKAVPAARS